MTTGNLHLHTLSSELAMATIVGSTNTLHTRFEEGVAVVYRQLLTLRNWPAADDFDDRNSVSTACLLRRQAVELVLTRFDRLSSEKTSGHRDSSRAPRGFAAWIERTLVQAPWIAACSAKR